MGIVDSIIYKNIEKDRFNVNERIVCSYNIEGWITPWSLFHVLEEKMYKENWSKEQVRFVVYEGTKDVSVSLTPYDKDLSKEIFLFLCNYGNVRIDYFDHESTFKSDFHSNYPEDW